MPTKVQTLLRLHRFIGSLICDEIGHDWDTVETDVDGHINVADVERCSRCDETRLKRLTSSTDSSAGGTIGVNY